MANAHLVDVTVGHKLTPVGVVWYVSWSDNEALFSTKALAVKYAARLRYDLMTGADH